MASSRSRNIFSFKILNVLLPVKNVRVQQIVKIYENIIVLAKAKRILC